MSEYTTERVSVCSNVQVYECGNVRVSECAIEGVRGCTSVPIYEYTCMRGYE